MVGIASDASVPASGPRSRGARVQTLALSCERQSELRQAEPLEDALHLNRHRNELLGRPDVRVVFRLQLLQPPFEPAVTGPQEHGLRVGARPDFVRRLEITLAAASALNLSLL